jgi:hypothetical protein
VICLIIRLSSPVLVLVGQRGPAFTEEFDQNHLPANDFTGLGGAEKPGP